MDLPGFRFMDPYIWIYIYRSFSIEVGTRISIDLLNQQFIVVTL